MTVHFCRVKGGPHAGLSFLYFSLSRQREVSKRELVARFESEQITILKNCAAGLASLKQVLALPSSPFFNHRICVPDSLAIATDGHSSLVAASPKAVATLKSET